MSNVVYTPTPYELEFAEHWHGGQMSMLYGISSSGNLSRGTLRPLLTDDAGVVTAMTDNEWSLHLVNSLQSELLRLALYVESDHDRTVRDQWIENMLALEATLEAKIEAEGD